MTAIPPITIHAASRHVKRTASRLCRARRATDRRGGRCRGRARLLRELWLRRIDELGGLARDDDPGIRHVLDREVSIVEVGEIDQPLRLEAWNVSVDLEVVD